LWNEYTGEMLTENARLARSVWEQLVGWIGCRVPPDGAALGIFGCSRIHTVGLGFPISVAYCDRTGRVLRIIDVVHPGRIAPGAAGARCAWETTVGVLSGRVEPGHRLVFEPARAAKPPAVTSNRCDESARGVSV
jgi:hypothetical protein